MYVRPAYDHYNTQSTSSNTFISGLSIHQADILQHGHHKYYCRNFERSGARKEDQGCQYPPYHIQAALSVECCSQCVMAGFRQSDHRQDKFRWMQPIVKNATRFPLLLHETYFNSGNTGPRLGALLHLIKSSSAAAIKTTQSGRE